MKKRLRRSQPDPFTPNVSLQPHGDRGKQPLPLTHSADAIICQGSYAKDAQVSVDWFNDKLQVLVFDGIHDAPQLHIRYRKDGTIEEVLVEDALFASVKLSDGVATAWEMERDYGGVKEWVYIAVLQSQDETTTTVPRLVGIRDGETLSDCVTRAIQNWIPKAIREKTGDDEYLFDEKISVRLDSARVIKRGEYEVLSRYLPTV